MKLEFDQSQELKLKELSLPLDHVREEEPEIPLDFDTRLITEAEGSEKQIPVYFAKFGLPSPLSLSHEKPLALEGKTTHISVHGLVFHTTHTLPVYTFIKMKLEIPDFWNRKQAIVSYDRVGNPEEFKIMGKVVRCEALESGDYEVAIKTLVMDEADEVVLRNYLKEGLSL